MRAKTDSEKSERIRGVYASLPTPFREDGQLDLFSFGNNVEKMAESGVDGIYITESTGEFFSLTESEFEKLVDEFIARSRDYDIDRQVGCTTSSMEKSIEKIKYVNSSGIETVHITFPYWLPLTDSEVMNFFERIYAACPEVNLIHYNTPRGRRTLTGEQYSRVKEKVPSLKGSKFPGADFDSWMELQTNAPGLGHFPTDHFMLPGLMTGANGVFSALVNMNPDFIIRLYRLIENGRWDRAKEMHRKMFGFLNEVTFPIVKEGHLDPVVDKIMAEIGGFLEGSRIPRDPYLSIDDDALAEYREITQKDYPELIYSQP